MVAESMAGRDRDAPARDSFEACGGGEETQATARNERPAHVFSMAPRGSIDSDSVLDNGAKPGTMDHRLRRAYRTQIPLSGAVPAARTTAHLRLPGKRRDGRRTPLGGEGDDVVEARRDRVRRDLRHRTGWTIAISDSRPDETLATQQHPHVAIFPAKGRRRNDVHADEAALRGPTEPGIGSRTCTNFDRTAAG